MATTINGYNSGLDIQTIVSSLVAAEKAPKEAQLSRLESATTAKITGIGQLKSAIADLQSVLKDLNKPELFEKWSATSSDSKLVSASASKDALAGSYKIEVSRLATSSKVATAAVSGGGEHSFASVGSLVISMGDEALPAIEVAAGATLKEIRDAINAQLKEQGVSANIVTDPKTNTSQLVLTSSKTGAGNDLTIQAFDADGNPGGDLAALDIPAYDAGNPAAGVSYISMAADAEFSIDGLALKSATNNVAGAIEGVTLNLVATTEAGKPVTLTVDRDKAGVTSTIKKFVDAYNKLMNTAATLTAVASVGEDKAPVTAALVGDASVRNLLTTARNELVKVSGDESDGIRILADLGITTQKDGTLKIDDSKLDRALNENFNSLTSFFTGDNGLMSRLDAKLDPYTKTDGVLEQRLSGLNKTISSVDDQREVLARRMQQLQARLLAQFNAMDALVGQLNQTSSRLAQSLASLPGLIKSDS